MKKLFFTLTIGLLLSAGASFASSNKSMIGQDLSPIPDSVHFLDKKPDLKGKPAIIEFWATWCPPCRQSIPHLNGLYKKYKDKGLEVVGITHESESVVRGFLKTLPINYGVGLDSKGSYSNLFQIEGIPHAVLVNQSGKIVWEGHPMQLKESDIMKVLK